MLASSTLSETMLTSKRIQQYPS